MLILARIVKWATAVVVLAIFAGLLMHVVGANSRNGIVSFVYDVDGTLTSPFAGMFHPSGFKERIVANWGVAAVVYAVAGALLASLVARMALVGGRAGTMMGRRRRARAV